MSVTSGSGATRVLRNSVTKWLPLSLTKYHLQIPVEHPVFMIPVSTSGILIARYKNEAVDARLSLFI